jgi:hypothetical protein
VERVYLHLGGPVANFSRHVIVAAAHFEKKVYVCVTVRRGGERERGCKEEIPVQQREAWTTGRLQQQCARLKEKNTQKKS